MWSMSRRNHTYAKDFYCVVITDCYTVMFMLILPVMALLIGLFGTTALATGGLPLSTIFLIIVMSCVFIPLLLIMFAFPFMSATAFMPIGIMMMGAFIFMMMIAGSFPMWCGIVFFSMLMMMFAIPFLSIPLGGQVGVFAIGCLIMGVLMMIFV